MDRLLLSSIRNVRKFYFDSTITSIELILASLEKANEIEYLNAYVTLADEEAKNEAHTSLYRYKTRASKSDLDGIPIAIKDNFCVANLRTTCAAKMLENFTPTYNATVYERLREAGAILIGKTNLDQFAMGSGTVDSIFGSARNPWRYNDNDYHIAGGSSGGSAIAVATGSCFAALGSDTGGSTRNPAAYCGVVGLKPTYGLVSRYGLIPLVNSMDVPGILTRNVDDCAILLNTIAGHDPKDSTTLTRRHNRIRLPPANKLSVKDLKIGIPIEYHCEHLDEEILAAWNEIALLLKQNGAQIRQVSLPHTEHSIVCYSILNQCEVASNMARYDGIEFGYRAGDANESTEQLYASTRRTGFNEVVRNRILTGNYFLLAKNYEKYFNQALKVRRLIANDFYKVWEECQVLLTPTTLTTAPKYNNFVKKTNRDQCAMQDYCTQPANMAGIPAISIPIKLSKEGLPISLQLMGRNLSEPMLLALAKFIESHCKFPRLEQL